MGSIKPNEGENNGNPAASTGITWTQLLNDEDGVYSLKTWEEVVETKANKTTIASALRELMKQAWSEYSQLLNFISSI